MTTLLVPHDKAALLAKLMAVLAALPWDGDFQELLTMLADNEAYLEANAAPLAHGHDGSTGTVAIVICTSATNPASPTLGMIKVETDTGFVGRCASVSPVLWSPLGGADILLSDTSTAANEYILTPNPAKTSYSSDDTYYFRPRTGVTSKVGSVASGRLATVTSGSTAVTLTTGTTTGLAVGMAVYGTGIVGGQTIASITGLTTFTLSANATASGSGVSLTFSKVVTCTITGSYNFQVTSGTTANILPGMYISGSGISAGCRIASVTDSTHFVADLLSTNASGIAVTVTIPIVELVLTTGDASDLTAGWQVEGSVIPRDTIIASIVDSSHLLLSAVPTSGSGSALTFNSGRNTGACVVDISSLGVKAIKLNDGTDPLSGNIRAGGIYMLKYDGTDLVLLNPSSPSGLTGSKLYATAGTYTFVHGVDCPAWVARLWVDVTGPGGGGAGSSTATGAGSGGAGGGYAGRWVALTAGQSTPVTVGAPGSAGAAGGGAGGAGGTSSFGAHCSATGGGGGVIVGAPGTAGTGSGGEINFTGTAGSSYSGATGGKGGKGAGPLGGEGGTTTSTVGNPGNAYGGGGAGATNNASTNNAGGAGAPGCVRVQW